MGARFGWWKAAGLLGILSLVLPSVLVLPWRWLDPPTTAFILRARLAGYDVRQEWVDWHGISAQMPLAVLAAEDQRFPQHQGFDLQSIRTALAERGERQRGASTISQQVVKNLFLWSGQSWSRKGVEAYLTIFLELLLPKRRILEIYLNIAEFGPGVFGVEAAARELFGRSATTLESPQAATLAAVLPNPKKMSAAEPSKYVQQRARWIQRQMQQMGGPSYLESL